MCLGVLALDRRFSNVLPRHPRGGPDQGRDIDARFQSGERAFGAVGFHNSVSDSPANKADAKRKFEHDIARALEADTSLKVFVFFTNVSLTIGEKTEITASGRIRGLSVVEIFDRERIRIALDSAEGLGLRYQYLNISLSDAEQASFFARWGNDLEQLVTEQKTILEAKLDRLEFLQEQAQPLTHLTFSMMFSAGSPPSDSQHPRALLSTKFSAFAGTMRGRTLHVLVCSATDEQWTEHGGIGDPGLIQFAWVTAPSSRQAPTAPRVELYSSFQTLPSLAATIKTSPFSQLPILGLSLADLNYASVNFFVSAKYAPLIAHIDIIANHYIVWQAFAGDIKIDESQTPAADLPHHKIDEADTWVRIKGGYLTDWLDFSRSTPRRLMSAEAIAGPAIKM
jgi:hypothetical protein